MNEEARVLSEYDWSKHTIAELEGFVKEIREVIVRMREEEKQQVKEQVIEIMKAAGFSPSDLGFSTVKKKVGKKRVLPAKYSNPETGETWAGTGRKPSWLAEELEAGKNLEDFAV
jgi:DNA-binding protein H-NS